MAVGSAGARGAASAALLACALGAWASPALAQAKVASARLQADLTGAGGEAAVRLEYTLSGVAAGDSVAVTLLDFGLAIPLEVRVGDAGEAVRVPVSLGAARRTRLPVAAAPDGGARLVVSYTVPLPPDAGRGTAVAHLPLLTVDGPSESARPGLFQAEVRVPREWTVTEAFPTGLGPDGPGGALRAQLPVVPSVVTLRFRTGSDKGIPLPLVLNIFAGACIALVGIAGWRQLAPGRP
ncbi:MAG TPA: hypothetical protein VLH75_12765 [Longimicrobiales bacterium]|nr:hypothetical protein [Longimicrobiales bacterium]